MSSGVGAGFRIFRTRFDLNNVRLRNTWVSYVYKVSVEDRTYNLFSHAIAGVYGASEEAVGVFASLTELSLPGELFIEISLKELIKLICLKIFYCIP